MPGGEREWRALDVAWSERRVVVYLEPGVPAPDEADGDASAWTLLDAEISCSEGGPDWEAPGPWEEPLPEG